MEGSIPLFGLGELNAEGMDQATINHFCLSIRLGMEGSGVLKLATQKGPKCFLEGTKKTRIYVWYDTRRKAKVSPHMCKENINSLSSSGGFGAREKKGHFWETKKQWPKLHHVSEIS